MRLAREYPKLALLLFAFFVYNINCRPIPAGDSVGAAVLPFSILYHGTVTLDPFAPAFQATYETTSGFMRQSGDRHYYSTYPILQPVLLTPLYLPLRLVPPIGRLRPETMILLARLLEKLVASLIAALSVVCMFALVRRLTGPHRALPLAAIYGFATNTWATSSQALWQHTAGQLVIAGSLLCLLIYLDGEGGRWAGVGAGLLAAIAGGVRPTNAVFTVVSILVVLILRRRILTISYVTSAVIVGGITAAYNLRIFHTIGGGYSDVLRGTGWIGFFGLTISPGRGLFVFTPVLLFSIIGFWRWVTSPPKRGWPLHAISAAFAAGVILATAKWPTWWGGECYGPRLLADIMPCLVLLIVPALDWIGSRRPARAAFIAAVAFSLGVQVIGVFFYPRGLRMPEDQWNPARSPIILNAEAGPATLHFRVLAMWAGQLAHGQIPDWRNSGIIFR